MSVRFSKTVVCLLLVLSATAFFSCTSPESAVTGVVETVCRSRLEGDYELYRENVGGDILVLEMTVPAYRRKFEAEAAAWKKSGTLFVDIYVRQLDIDPVRRTASIFFIEKWSRGTRTFTASRRWTLEYIDSRWRVVTF